MASITILGLAAATLTTIAGFPQLIKTIKMKETKDISLLMYVSLVIGISLWLIYGIIIKNIPIIAANAVSLIPNTAVLFLKIKYK